MPRYSPFSLELKHPQIKKDDTHTYDVRTFIDGKILDASQCCGLHGEVLLYEPF